ncbi:ORF6C domain-containing protein [Bacillus hominis]|uniref:KilA-N DNA-binding domain-containing protein n=1 Tax=Bacillus mycoides TaxID=1405 RepID=A0A1S9T882_BACMY|nr:MULTISPECIES: ORF6C domain-containing protein [Bacillus cereus group]MDM5195493.1 ORF6C domain-containing protein [Bacillus hominis]OOR05781.1 hypothetical protein BW900_15745 [Bacillus mycoides]
MDQLTVANELHILGKQNIAGYEFTGIEGGFSKDGKAMLAKEIAEIHGKELKHINLRINENRSRFKDDIDIVDLRGTKFEVGLADHNILSKMMISKSKNIYLLSERGYAKLLKILEDDKAWELYDRFVDGYFNMREQQQVPADPFSQIKLIATGTVELNNRVNSLESLVHEQWTIDYGQQRVLQKAKANRIYSLWKNGSINKEVHDTTSKLFGLLGKNLKDAFSVNSYRDILKKDFEEALSFIKGWRPMV